MENTGPYFEWLLTSYLKWCFVLQPAVSCSWDACKLGGDENEVGHDEPFGPCMGDGVGEVQSRGAGSLVVVDGSVGELVVGRMVVRMV